MTILVTGCAGFIGMHVAEALLQRGATVLGIDDLNAYYNVTLKHDRLKRLFDQNGFTFACVDISDHIELENILAQHQPSHIIHLAAQAGVRYSIKAPRSYIQSNILGHLNILEWIRQHGCAHLVYASSSSVYGSDTLAPFEETARADQPISLYAATKRSDELMGYTYAHLYGVKQTGLRFFTVYGAFGRPDMAYWRFTDAILKGEKIELFNQGQVARDFTAIEDIVKGIIAAIERPPQDKVPHRIYNLGHTQAVAVDRFVDVLEQACGRTANRVYVEAQPGDVALTLADTRRAEAELDWKASIPIEDGLPRFVRWYRDYTGL